MYQFVTTSRKGVISAQAGIQPRSNQLKTLDYRFHGNDEIGHLMTFCVTFNS
jgi:hypothetical protein